MKEKFNEDYFHGIEKSSRLARIKPEFDHILDVVPIGDGERILDVGCGTGFFGRMVMERNSSASVVFSDISPVAKDYLEGLEFVCTPAEKTPFPDEHFDKVFCLHVISHVYDKDAVIKEFLRITKKGGTLVIIGPNKKYVYLMKTALFFGLIPSYNFDKTAKWLLTPTGLRQLLEGNGWTVVKMEYFGHYIKKLSAFNSLGLRVLAIAKK